MTFHVWKRLGNSLQPEARKENPGASVELESMSGSPSYQLFASSDALQDYLLQDSRGALVVVPHRRLAHQIWHRQRQAALKAGSAAWEPLPLITLQAWLQQLFQSLWPPVVMAPSLTRLVLWGRALQLMPPPEGPTPELEWAQALDEIHALLGRHLLEALRPTPADTPLVAWRRRITRTYIGMLRDEGCMAPGELPAYLLAALEAGKIGLPARVVVVGLETAAPAEEAWLRAVAARTRVVHLRVQGDAQAVAGAVVLPDQRQEIEWVAARLLEAAHSEKLPLHRLAVTSPAMERYGPQLQRILSEVLGPPHGPTGWAYNFSPGSSLAETPLLQAALLPMKFAAGERREDLVSLLLSPYYGILRSYREELALWDRVFREERVDQGWELLRETAARHLSSDNTAPVLSLLKQTLEFLEAPLSSGRQWAEGLVSAWAVLGFPPRLDEAEADQWRELTGLLRDLEEALGSESLTRSEFLDWLTHGASKTLWSGPGVQEAGVQVLGLLEMRGLAFSRVFCLGMNSGVFPAPPRPLPLLNRTEKQAVLGGTYESQHRFARELYQTVLGAAPAIVLTRPRLEDQEERVGTPFCLIEWQPRESAVLSAPQAAWMRSPAVKAAFEAVSRPPWVGYCDGPVPLLSPAGELSVTQLAAALACPCRFLLEVVLGLKELPDLEAGLDPRDRGSLLHQVLARFAAAFNRRLDEDGIWDQDLARELLEKAAHETLGGQLADLNWQAERERWLGDEGLLWEWLRREEERFHQGWRWHGFEVRFQGLKRPGWPWTLKGRIDRLDCHGEKSRLLVWDYKTGELPGMNQVFEAGEEHQLPCYLLAVREGCVEFPPELTDFRAGFIGLKSSRDKHLKHQEFEKQAHRWDEVLLAFEARVESLGRRLAAGNFSPQPAPAPAGRKQGACQYCSYRLICGFGSGVKPASEEEET